MASSDDVNEVLPCALTGPELQQKAELLGNAYDSYCEIEARKKEANKTFNDGLKDARAEMKLLTQQIRTRAEERTVLCRWVEDKDHAVTRLIRQDTGDVVRERTLSKMEMQETLGFDDSDDEDEDEFDEPDPVAEIGGGGHESDDVHDPLLS